MDAWLEVCSHGRPSRREALGAEVDSWSIGRQPSCAVWLEDSSVSRHHAQIERDEEGFVLTDRGSRNGTRVNGDRLTESVRLVEGDRIEICDHQLVFRGASDSALGGVTWVDTGATVASDVHLALDVSHASLGRRPTPQVALDALLEITQALGRMEPKGLLRRLLDVSFRVLPAASRGVVFALGAEAREVHEVDRWIDDLELVAHRVRNGVTGDVVDAADGDEVRISRSILRLALRDRQAVMASHAADDQRVDSSASLLALEVESWLCVPILDPGSDLPIGVIELLGESQRDRFESRDLELVSALAAAAAVAVQNASMLAERQAEALARDRRERDLDHAREIQRSFLPRGVPPVSNYRFASHYAAAESIGGDYYVLDLVPGGQASGPGGGGRLVAVGIGDVSGKGLPAALLMARLSSDMRFALAGDDAFSSPAAVLGVVNAALRGSTPESRFISLWLGVLDSGRHRFRYGNCGHAPALARRADGRVEELAAGQIGVPLNVLEAPRVEDGETEIAVGDLVLLYTDGLTEVRDRSGEEFGIAGVRSVLERVTEPEALVAELVRATRDFAGGVPMRDDMTFVCFSRLE